jgi:hypothetical protein
MARPATLVRTLPTQYRDRRSGTVLPTAAGSPCRHCGSSRTSVTDLTLSDGTPVEFRTCRACEQREWWSVDGPLVIAEVLRRTARPRRAG